MKKDENKLNLTFKKEDPKKLSLLIKRAKKWRTVIKRKFTLSSTAVIIPSRFFAVPFAISGDKVAIPNDIQPSGDVSYTTGWGADYSADPEINPSAKQVPRVGFNELSYDITLAIQQYQIWGTPNFITEEETVDGNPFPYSNYAYALFDDGVNGPRIFQSNSDTNTQVPVVSTLIQSNWRVIDSTNAQAVIFNNVTFDTGVVANSLVYWNPGSPGKYALALANGAAPQNALGFADVANSRVIAFGIVPGFTGLTPGAVYYLSPTTPGAIVTPKPASNITQIGIARDATTLFVNIQAEIPGSFLPVGTSIDYYGTDGAQPGFLIEDGTAVSRTTYAALFAKIGISQGPGDGTTTFNLPNSTRMSSVGAGGTATSGPGTTIGVASSYTPQLIAIPTSALPAHVHGVTDPGHTHSVADPGHAHDITDPGHAHEYVNQVAIAQMASGAVLVNNDDVAANTVADVTNITVDAHLTDIGIDAAGTNVTVNSAGAGSASLVTYGPCYVVSKQIYTGVF